jgi:diacylglycerol kinase (ATP)
MQSIAKTKPHTPEQELELALEEMRTIVSGYETCYCKIEIDGKDYSDDYLMVEVMNIRSIGPNLHLGPDVEVDDGVFDVVLLSEKHRKEFGDHLADKLKGNEANPALTIVKGKRIKLKWEGADCHVDDERIEITEPGEIVIEIEQGLIEFLVP